MKDDLDAAKQKGCDYCLEEQTTAVVKIQGGLYQAGYERGLSSELST